MNLGNLRLYGTKIKSPSLRMVNIPKTVTIPRRVTIPRKVTRLKGSKSSKWSQ